MADEPVIWLLLSEKAVASLQNVLVDTAKPYAEHMHASEVGFKRELGNHPGHKSICWTLL
jgi:hypothetical protein